MTDEYIERNWGGQPQVKDLTAEDFFKVVRAVKSPLPVNPITNLATHAIEQVREDHKREQEQPMADKFTHPNDAPEGHEWQTRDGQEVTQLVAFDAPHSRQPIMAVIEGEIYSFFPDGRFSEFKPIHCDLIDKPKKPREVIEEQDDV